MLQEITLSSEKTDYVAKVRYIVLYFPLFAGGLAIQTSLPLKNICCAATKFAECADNFALLDRLGRKSAESCFSLEV